LARLEVPCRSLFAIRVERIDAEKPSSLSDLRTRIKFEARGFVLRRFDFGRDN
jgi:hypothetical protein